MTSHWESAYTLGWESFLQRYTKHSERFKEIVHVLFLSDTNPSRIFIFTCLEISTVTFLFYNYFNVSVDTIWMPGYEKLNCVWKDIPLLTQKSVVSCFLSPKNSVFQTI